MNLRKTSSLDPLSLAPEAHVRREWGVLLTRLDAGLRPQLASARLSRSEFEKVTALTRAVEQSQRVLATLELC